MERINQYHKHLEDKKRVSAGARPLSGGVNSKVKSESQKSRVMPAGKAI